MVLHPCSPTDGRDAFDGELRRLGSHWARFWAGCDPVSAADEVRARLDAAVAAWDLDGVEVLAGGVVALVCCAARHGEPVVVKVHPRVAGSEALAHGSMTSQTAMSRSANLSGIRSIAPEDKVSVRRFLYQRHRTVSLDSAPRLDAVFKLRRVTRQPPSAPTGR